jgi:hypothetical protein
MLCCSAIDKGSEATLTLLKITMKLLNIDTPSVEASNTSETALTQKRKTTRSKLSMIWVKEFDGKRQRLVGQWVTED